MKCSARLYHDLSETWSLLTSCKFCLSANYIHTIRYGKSNTPFSYMLCLLFKTAYRELNQERALDEGTGPGYVFYRLHHKYVHCMGSYVHEISDIFNYNCRVNLIHVITESYKS